VRVPSARRLLLSAAVAAAIVPAADTAAQAATCRNADVDVATAGDVPARAAVRCLLNDVRADHGLRRLHGNARLQRAAARHSRDMVRRRYFGHNSPTGGTLVTRVRAASYLDPRAYWTVGENIGWGTARLSTPRAMVRAWMHSPGHRANILNGSFRDLGVGIALGDPEGGHGITYTADFARQALPPTR
jgi:uncharacterized protein YkwD